MATFDRITIGSVSSGSETSSRAPEEAIDLHELLAQAGSESSVALSSAIERVNTLAHSGRIDRAGLRALREELERARRANTQAQQISRIGSTRVRVYEEKIDLTTLVRDTAGQRTREFEGHGITLRQQLTPVTVVSDITVVFAMLGALFDWCLEQAHGQLDLSLDVKSLPALAQLSCAFAHAKTDANSTGASSAPKTLAWRLVEVCARKLNLSLDRQSPSGRTVVQIGFPKTVMGVETMDTLLDAHLDNVPSTHNSRPLAGSHVLVVCARRELRVEIREAVQSMGLMVDFVANIDEAREFCATGLPHAIIFEAAQGGSPMLRLMGELCGENGVVFVEIAESGKPFHVNNLGGHEVSCVARSSLREALPTALTFELTRI